MERWTFDVREKKSINIEREGSNPFNEKADLDSVCRLGEMKRYGGFDAVLGIGRSRMEC